MNRRSFLSALIASPLASVPALAGKQRLEGASNIAHIVDRKTVEEIICDDNVGVIRCRRPSMLILEDHDGNHITTLIDISEGR